MSTPHLPDPNVRIVGKGKHLGEITVRLHPEKLPAAQEETSRRTERKYNMRIKGQDVALLDALADQVDRPRSQIINELLHGILLSELQALGETDAQVLVAVTADADAPYDPLARPWVFDALRSDVAALIQNNLWHTYDYPLDFPSDASPELRAEMEAGRNSQAFNILKAQIEGLGR